MATRTHRSAGALTAPVRNLYFYGKLLDVRSQEREQSYGIQLRRLLNRFTVGAGVICGLEVRATADGQVWIAPGMAIDGFGREVFVTEPYCVTDPQQPVDACGDPEGDPVTDGAVTVCLAYHDCEVDPVPVLIDDCDVREGCRAGAVRERYRVLIRAGEAEAWGGLDGDQCRAIFPAHPPDDFDRRDAACDVLTGPCPEPAPECVPLATLVFAPERPLEVHQCTGRTTVYSNARLFDMLVCLAARMDACCAARLHYVSGDAQTAAPGADLEEPLVVEVRDHDDQPVADEPVTFRALGGAGQVDDGGGLAPGVTVPSAGDGRAQARWRLGPAAGLNTLEATIAGGGRIAFHALSSEAATPPYVEQVWPPNRAHVRRGAEGETEKQWLRNWVERPRIEIVFDREMDPGELAEPDRWMRLWCITNRDDYDFIRNRMPLSLIDAGAVPAMTTDEGVRVVWDIELGDQDPLLWSRWLLQIRARDPDAPIHEAGVQHQLLDADFDGTTLSVTRLREYFDTPAMFPTFDDWQGLSGGGSLDGPPHSGDGQAGGELNLWFEIGEEDQ